MPAHQYREYTGTMLVPETDEDIAEIVTTAYKPVDVAEIQARQLAETDWTAKECSGPCQRMLPLTSYHKDKRSPDGHENKCKDCRAGKGGIK